MNGRRNFFALVGSAAVSGLVARRASATQPTLILPPALVTEAPTPAAYPLLAAEETQMHAVISIKRGMPDAAFLDWLEGGLRQARFYGGQGEAATERRVEAAIERHGSIIAAMRAGAL